MKILLSPIWGSVLIALLIGLLFTPAGRAFLKSAQAWRQQAKKSLSKQMKLLSQPPDNQKRQNKIPSSNISKETNRLVRRRWSLTGLSLTGLKSRLSKSMTIAAIAIGVVIAEGANASLSVFSVLVIAI